MKCTIALTLLAFAAAQPSDNEYNYEAPAEQQAEPQYFQEAEEAQTQELPVAKVCVTCDEYSPCWNGESCSGFSNYHEQTADYKEGFEKQECPCGTVDTRHYHVHNNVVLWIAFGLLFGPALYFLCSGFKYRAEGDVGEWYDLRIGAGVVNTVASLAYLVMALGYGFTTRCNGRDFYYARYVDWLITTPIMLHKYIQIANGGDELTQIFLVVLDIFMIAAGLIGELVTGSERWAFFGFGMLTFVPILYILCHLVTVVTDDNTKVAEKLFNTLVWIVSFAWIGYPIIWILANVHTHADECAADYAGQAVGAVSRVGVLSAQGEAIAYSVLDIISKSIVGWFIVSVDVKSQIPGTTPISGTKSAGNSAGNKTSQKNSSPAKKTSTQKKAAPTKKSPAPTKKSPAPTKKHGKKHSDKKHSAF